MSKLTNQPDWKNSSTSLLAGIYGELLVMGVGCGAPHVRPVGLFSAQEKHLFDHADRVHPIYFEYPFERSDDVSIDLPVGWQISTIPQPQKLDAKAIVYSLRDQE